MPQADVSDDYSQEFVIYSETGIDISFIVAFHHKFHHQDKTTTVYRLLVCSFSLASITEVMSIFRRQERFYPLFCWPQRCQRLVSWQWMSCFPSYLSSAITNLTAPWTLRQRGYYSYDPVSVCLSVCHRSVFYRNGWTNRAGFWHGSFLPPVLHCVDRKFDALQK